MRPQINSEKHYVQQSISTVTASTKLDVNILTAVAAGDVDLVNEVRVGATVKAIYVELWVRASEVSPGSGVFIVEKRPAGVAAATTANMAALGTYANKKNVFFVSQGLYNDQDSTATPLIRGWIKIPKGKQRMALGDKISMTIFAQGAIDLVICGCFIYKEYF